MNREVNLIINGKDARKQWGVVTTSNTLSALLAPPSMKSRATFDSRLEDGIRIDTSSPKVAQRDMKIFMHATPPSARNFKRRNLSYTPPTARMSCTGSSITHVLNSHSSAGE